MLKYPDRKLLMLNIDAGGVQSRRVLERLIAQERSGQQQDATAAG
jgi:vanillate O-demethylase monooxygenase subunit